MKNLILLLLVVAMAAGGYGYQKNPKACQKLGLDMVNDARAIFLPSSSTNSASAPFTSSPPPDSSSPTPPSATSAPQPVPPPQPTVEPGTLLDNGDFAKGDSGWQGDGTIDRSVGRALVVALKSDAWTMISQDFRGDQGTVDTITINFEASADISPSTDATDYADIYNKIRFEGYEGYASVTLPVGDFLYQIGDLTNHAGRYEMYPLKAGAGQLIKIQHAFPAFPASSTIADKVVVLAFPPGTGRVIIRTVSVTSQ